MASLVGQTLGRYQIVEEIGAGGMGVVYRAHDERLDRDLALKVMAPGALADEAARRRFRQEALILSRLNHPAIQVIHDFETQDGLDFLVSELVPGTTLDGKLAAGALPEKDVVRLGVQLAQGLAASHAAGVLHRDLKPGNVRVTPDGRLKILDFGLATLSREAVLTLSTAHSLAETPSGVGGTAPYMPPEQLLGENVDERSDIYAAGAVLYEMATGQRAFPQTNATRLTNAVLHEPPQAPRKLNGKISPELERIVLKCLEKDPELRYQSAKELTADLRRMEAGSQATHLVAAPARRARRTGIALAGAGLVLVIAIFAGWQIWRKSGSQTASGPVQFEQITNFTDSASVPALSPDGKMVAFVRGGGNVGGSSQRGQVWIKLLPRGDAVQLTHDDVGKSSVTFSPDGAHVAYTQLRERFIWDTWEVPVLGGEPRPMLPNASGLTWIGPDRVMFSEVKADEGVHMGVVTSGPSRGDERAVYWPKAVTNMAHNSALSPDGKWVLVVEMDGTGWLPCRVVPFDGTGAVRQVGPEGACTAAKWSPDGRWMYFTVNVGGAFHLWRQRFPEGQPEQLTSGITEEEGIAVSPDGRSLITAAGLRESTVWMHDKQGDRQITFEGFSFLPTLSRDARIVYYLTASGKSRSYVSGELWTADLSTGRKERLLPGQVLAHYDISPDGAHVVFASPEVNRSGIWIAPLDRSAPPRQLTRGGEYRAFFAADGDIIYMTNSEPRHLRRIKADGTGDHEINPDPILHLMSVSRDGRWAAIIVSAGHSGELKVIAYPLAGGSPVLLCDVCIGGFGPARANASLVSWTADGQHLFVSLQFFAMQSRKTLVVPLKPGSPPPTLTPGGKVSEQSFLSRPGNRLLNEQDVFPGPNAETYAFCRRSTRTNLYSVRLP